MELKNRRIELHNEEVREIMKKIPGRLIHWGLAIIFLIFLSIIIGSYFFTFKEKVIAPLVITTLNPPAAIISKASGRIEKWFVKDGEIVKTGGQIAYIHNSGDLSDINKLNLQLLAISELNFSEVIDKTFLEENLKLGDLQKGYNQFFRSWMDYKDYLHHQFLKKRIELLAKQIEKQQQHFQLSIQQQHLMEKELEIYKQELKKQKGVWKKGGLSVSKLEESKVRIIQSERALLSFQASIKSTEINLVNQKKAMLDLKEQNRKNIVQYENKIIDNIKSLKVQINKWENTYMLKSPIEGKISLTRYWSKNQSIVQGDRLATVIPEKKSEIICRAVLGYDGISKVEMGQEVLIKLAGYSAMEYGMLKGKVRSISKVPEKEGYYIEIRLDRGMISSSQKKLKMVQDLTGTAEIITNEMRMIYRFINPLKMIFGEN